MSLNSDPENSGEYQAVVGIFNSFGVVRQAFGATVDFIYGYSYSILSEL
jgi:hypothetical protein